MNVEQDLVVAIEPIRQMTLAICTNHFFESGIYAKLDGAPCSLTEISQQLSLEPNRLEGLLNYLRNENLVFQQDGKYELTERARLVGKYKAWYTMLVGGYTETFVQVGECLKGQGRWATRDVGKVGIGSCGISHYDAIPLTQRLMSKMEQPASTMLDLGCGNAMYLVEFCKTMPQLRACGVEPSKAACDSAQSIVSKEGLENRISIVNKSVREFLQSEDVDEPDLLVLGFILQEVLGQEGRSGVIDFLVSVLRRYPKITLIVIEVDNQVSNPTVMEHRLAKAYYNPYYLIHEFTEQQLMTDSWWEELFAEAGLQVLAKDHPDSAVDSTNLEIGYLLRGAN
ncbi:2-ketoarginine methyltransferase [Hydrogenophaga sp. 5NK40-0174]|uniref:2-ketoarginine methyltransferase n=1 Tax=Hydrogenophaga sp. 5NK40-0174 TaxID=3127649 RepID=UPI0031020043